MTAEELYSFLSSAMTGEPSLQQLVERYEGAWDLGDGRSISTFRVWAVIAGTLRSGSGKAAALRWGKERGIPAESMEKWRAAAQASKKRQRVIDGAMQLMTEPDPRVLEECFKRGMEFEQQRMRTILQEGADEKGDATR